MKVISAKVPSPLEGEGQGEESSYRVLSEQRHKQSLGSVAPFCTAEVSKRAARGDARPPTVVQISRPARDGRDVRVPECGRAARAPKRRPDKTSAVSLRSVLARRRNSFAKT